MVNRRLEYVVSMSCPIRFSKFIVLVTLFSFLSCWLKVNSRSRVLSNGANFVLSSLHSRACLPCLFSSLQRYGLRSRLIRQVPYIVRETLCTICKPQHLVCQHFAASE